MSAQSTDLRFRLNLPPSTSDFGVVITDGAIDTRPGLCANAEKVGTRAVLAQRVGRCSAPTTAPRLADGRTKGRCGAVWSSIRQAERCRRRAPTYNFGSTSPPSTRDLRGVIPGMWVCVRLLMAKGEFRLIPTAGFWCTVRVPTIFRAQPGRGAGRRARRTDHAGDRGPHDREFLLLGFSGEPEALFQDKGGVGTTRRSVLCADNGPSARTDGQTKGRCGAVWSSIRQAERCRRRAPTYT